MVVFLGLLPALATFGSPALGQLWLLHGQNPNPAVLGSSSVRGVRVLRMDGSAELCQASPEPGSAPPLEPSANQP